MHVLFRKTASNKRQIASSRMSRMTPMLFSVKLYGRRRARGVFLTSARPSTNFMCQSYTFSLGRSPQIVLEAFVRFSRSYVLITEKLNNNALRNFEVNLSLIRLKNGESNVTTYWRIDSHVTSTPIRRRSLGPLAKTIKTPSRNFGLYFILPRKYDNSMLFSSYANSLIIYLYT